VSLHWYTVQLVATVAGVAAEAVEVQGALHIAVQAVPRELLNKAEKCLGALELLVVARRQTLQTFS